MGGGGAIVSDGEIYYAGGLATTIYPPASISYICERQRGEKRRVGGVNCPQTWDIPCLWFVYNFHFEI